MKIKGHVLALLALLVLAVSPSMGQGVSYNNIVLQSGGFPFATIRVCTEPALGTPCSPLALIYSDPALTNPLSNPFTSDANGNYTFFATPTLTYHIQISGNGILTSNIPFVTLPGGGGGGSGATTLSINGTVFPIANLNGTLPLPDAGQIAATFKVSGTNVIAQVPVMNPLEFCLSNGTGIGSQFNIGFQDTTDPCLHPAIGIIQQARGGMGLFGPVATFGTLFALNLVDVGNFLPLVDEFPVCTTPVVANTVVKVAMVAGNACAVPTVNGDTVPEGIAESGASIGFASVARVGVVKCTFDGASTAGDHAVISPTAAPLCHDSGSSTKPTGDLGVIMTTNAAAGLWTVNVSSASHGSSGGGGGGGSGTVSAGGQYQVPVYPAAGTTVGPSVYLSDNQATGQLIYAGPLGMSLTAPGTPTWTGTFGACGAPPSSTQSSICFGASGNIQASQAGSSYQAFVFQNAINGSWINSGLIDISFLNQTELNSNYLQLSLATGTTNSAALVAADVGSAPSGSSICTDVNDNLTTIGCPSGGGGANTALSNVSGVTAFSSNLAFAVGFGSITTTSNGALSLLPNGTGPVVIPQGSAANTALQFTGDAAGNGLYLSAVGSIIYSAAGNPTWQIASAAGFKAKNSLCYGWSSTTNASGAYDTAFSRTAANTAGLGSTCGGMNATLQLGTLAVQGSSSGQALITASATGGTLNLGSNNATVSSAGAGIFASLESNGALINQVNSISFSTTPVFNLALGNIQQFACTTPSSVIVPTTSGLVAGQIMTLIFIQNSGTACTLTYPSTMHGGTVIGSVLSGVNAQNFVVSGNGTDLYATGAMTTNSTGGTP